MAKAESIGFGRRYLAEIRALDRRLLHAIETFIDAKMAGRLLGKRDKASGHLPVGKVAAPFPALGLRHYKLHERNADPLLVYQELDGGRRLVLVAVKRHDEIFHGQEAQFLADYADDLVPPGTSGR